MPDKKEANFGSLSGLMDYEERSGDVLYSCSENKNSNAEFEGKLTGDEERLIEIQNTMVLSDEEIGHKQVVDIEKKRRGPIRINSGSLSFLNILQVLVALGIWIGSIIGLSRTDHLKVVHVASLFSTAIVSKIFILY